MTFFFFFWGETHQYEQKKSVHRLSSSILASFSCPWSSHYLVFSSKSHSDSLVCNISISCLVFNPCLYHLFFPSTSFVRFQEAATPRIPSSRHRKHTFSLFLASPPSSSRSYFILRIILYFPIPFYLSKMARPPWIPWFSIVRDFNLENTQFDGVPPPHPHPQPSSSPSSLPLPIFILFLIPSFIIIFHLSFISFPDDRPWISSSTKFFNLLKKKKRKPDSGNTKHGNRIRRRDSFVFCSSARRHKTDHVIRTDQVIHLRFVDSDHLYV